MLNILHKMNIRTGSVVWAIQDVNEFYSNKSQSEYEAYIKQLTKVDVATKDALDAEIIFKYIIKGIIQDDTRDVANIITEATQGAFQLISDQGSSMRMTRNPTVVEEINGVRVTRAVSHRSGVSKRDQANTIMEENKLLTKIDVIPILATALEISKQNALVYYYKWSKQRE